MKRISGLVGVVLASATLLSGCGGGGGTHSKGNAKGSGVLSVTLDADRGAAAGPAGTVHTLAVYRNDGSQVDTKTVDLSSGTTRVDFSGLPAGTLHLHAGLRESAGGPEVGAVDTTFEGGGAADPIVLEMRQTPAAAELTPAAASVSVGKTKALYAAATVDKGVYVYTAPSDWAWSSDAPGVASVDASGNVTGVALGSASVRAACPAFGVAASSTVGVTQDGVTKGKWTIMVYMDAANTLYPYAPLNINQMESITKPDGDVRFVVQWKQVKNVGGNANPSFSGTRRYVTVPDHTSAVKATLAQDLGANVDMGSPAALKEFVAWSKAKYPADHYALVLWSHGGGWFSTRAKPAVATRAIIYDEESNNYLSLPDVRGALDDGALDLLAYDACLMQGAESLLEFAGKADYVVGSEDNVPGTGLPYNLVFKPFVDSPDTATGSLASQMIDAYVGTYKGTGIGFPIQMSALDTSKAGAVAVALDKLGLALANDGGAATAVPAARAAVPVIEPSDGYSYYDLTGVASSLGGSSSTSLMTKAAATELASAISAATVATSTDTASLRGVSIEFARSGEFAGYAKGYGSLQLSKLTHWNEFLASPAANP